MDIDRTTARLALAVGVGVVASDVSFGIFAVVGEPFGSLNDLGNACVAILAGGLAWTLRARAGLGLTAAALAGSTVAVAGSALVLSGTTGWLLAGHVSTLGFALIGPAVIVASRSFAVDSGAAGQAARVGVAAGAVMLAGVAALAPVLMRVDDPSTAPAWTWLPFVGWIGSFVLFPIWTVRLARSGRGVRLAGAAG
jgi:hypothetical protein